MQATERKRGRAAVAQRARRLRDNPLCAHCLPRVTMATEVDHIIPLHKGGPDTDDNCQSLCAECHKVKTNADKGHKRRVQIGLDGYPLEGS